MDLHAAAGALVLGRRRRAETGGLRQSGFTGLLLHLQFRLRQIKPPKTKQTNKNISEERQDRFNLRFF